jgi:hypothetical protein
MEVALAPHAIVSYLLGVGVGAHKSVLARLAPFVSGSVSVRDTA